MKVHEDDRRALAQRLHLAMGDAERVVDGGHVHPAHHVQHANRSATLRARDVAAAAGRVGVVGRAQQARLDGDVVEHLALVPDVVARREDVGARVEQALANLARDAIAARGVFAVDDHQIDAVAGDQRGEPDAHEIPAGPTDHIADEEEIHLGEGVSIAIGTPRPRRSPIRGSVTRSSPFSSVARALLPSKAVVNRTARAKRPDPRSTR